MTSVVENLSYEELCARNRAVLIDFAFKQKRKRAPEPKELDSWSAYFNRTRDVRDLLSNLARASGDEGSCLSPLGVIPPLAIPLTYEGSIEAIETPERLKVGMPEKFKVKVENRSNHSWHVDEKKMIRVCYHWFNEKSEVVIYDGHRTPLPHRLDPGESVEAEVIITPPSTIGSYILELSLVHEGACWFEERGFRTCRLTLEVSWCFSPSIERAWKGFEMYKKFSEASFA